MVRTHDFSSKVCEKGESKCHIALVFERPWFDPSPQYLILCSHNFYKILGDLSTRKVKDSTVASIFSDIVRLIFQCEQARVLLIILLLPSKNFHDHHVF